LPVIGVVDPSHKANKASATPPPWLPVEELLSKAYTAEPKWSPYTFEIINAALGEIEERGDNISTTTLTGPCPRSTVLERKEDYYRAEHDLTVLRRFGSSPHLRVTTLSVVSLTSLLTMEVFGTTRTQQRIPTTTTRTRVMRSRCSLTATS
jgi:hypothetical protein